MKNVLITGAAGFIGSAVAQKFLDSGYAVVTVDNLSTGFREAVPGGAEFIEADIGDESVLERLSEYRFDGIIHIAGQSSGEVSFEKPVYDLKTNTLSTLLLLRLAREQQIRRVLFASSMSVYGDVESLPAGEETPVRPKSLYAVGKLASEHYLRIYSGERLRAVSLRLFNVYGPGQNLSNLKQGMLSIYLAQALEDGNVLVKGPGNRFRDFVYIDDVVDAFYRLYHEEVAGYGPAGQASGTGSAGEEGAPGGSGEGKGSAAGAAGGSSDEDTAAGRKTGSTDATGGYSVYNICSGRRVTVDEILEKIQEAAGLDLNVTYAEGTPGDQFGMEGEYSKIEREWGWTPTVDFDDGLKRTMEWAKAGKEK